MSYIIFAVCVLLLIMVLIPGIGSGLEEKGGNRWITFGSFGFQPSEIVKIGFILTMAKHISLIEQDVNKPKTLAFLVLHMVIVVGLVLLQPDLGTALVFISIFITMLFFAGLNYKYILCAIGGVIAAMPVFWFFILRDYQKTRIYTFLNPESDMMNTGYQVVQSKIAVGSGQLFGKGFMKGSAQFGFLPERHTDFIFSVISEEFGFIGSVIVVALLFAIIGRCIYIARNAKNSLGTYITLGVVAMLLFQVFENVGMCIGLMPVTGITLPFISYGGSSLVTNMVALGLVFNVRYRYKVINF